MATALSRPTELLQRSWTRFKSRWQLAIVIGLLTSLVYIGVSIVFTAGLLTAGPGLQLGTAMTSIAVWMIALVLLGAYFTSLMLILMNDDKPATLGQVMKRTSKIYWPIVVTALVSCLTVGGATILLIIPGIILSVYFSQSQLVAVNEGLSGQPALRRSRSLVNGKWGAVLWRMIFLGIILALVNAVAAGILKIFGAGQVNAENISSAITGLVTGPLTVAYMVELYRDLRGTAGEKGSRGLYTALAILGALGIAGFIALMPVMVKNMGGTFESEWQKAIEESGTSFSGSSSFNIDWGTTDYPDTPVSSDVQ